MAISSHPEMVIFGWVRISVFQLGTNEEMTKINFFIGEYVDYDRRHPLFFGLTEVRSHMSSLQGLFRK